MNLYQENHITTDLELDLSRSPVHLIHTLRQAADEILSTKLAASGLTPRQFTLLYVISQNPGLSQSEAGAAAGSDRSTIAELTRRMETIGFITRSRSKQDTRTAVLHLTELGRKHVESALPAVIAANDAVIGVLDEDLREKFVNALLELTTRSSTIKSSH